MAFSEIAPFIKPENRTTGIQQCVSVILDNYIVYHVISMVLKRFIASKIFITEKDGKLC